MSEVKAISEDEPLYKMRFAELLCVHNYEVMRVPGGWIFTRFHEDSLSSVFVPFHNEFQRVNKDVQF
jgi:hypothetical protein